jgi:PAS domain S-box-containing protein
VIKRSARAAGEEKRRDSELHLRAVVDSAPVILFALDREGVFTLSEGNGLRALGYEPGQVVGMSVFEVHRDAPEILQHVRRALGGESVSAIAEVGGLSFETYYDPLRGQDGEVVGVIGVATDVTERKWAYDRLARSERRFSTLLANAPAYYYRCRNEPSWPDEFVSDYARELTGYTPGELTDGTVMFADLIVEEDRQRVWEEVQAALARRRRFKLRYTIRHKDGTARHIEEHGQGVYGEDGEVLALEGVVHDVTERERSEGRLREAEERYRALVERTPAVTYVQDARGSGAVTYVSPQMRDLLGYEPEECISDPEHWRKVLHPADRERVLAEDARSNETGEPFRMEYRQIAKDGRVVWIRDEADLVRDKEDRPLFWLGVQYDVTERRAAEEEKERRARQAELRADVSAALAAGGTLRDILQRCVESVVRNLDAAFARVWILNQQGDTLELKASAGMYTHLDGPHSRVPVGSFKIGLIAQERRAHLTNDVANDPRVSDKGWAQREGIAAFAGYPLIVEDRLVGVAAMFAREPLEEDTLEALASVADAIAQGVERKRAEEELRRGERSLAEAQRIAHVGNWEYDVSKDEVRWSDEMYRIFGFTPRAFAPTYKTFLRSVHPDDRGFLWRSIREALRNGGRAELEYRIVRPDGEVRMVHTQYEVGYEEGTGSAGLTGTVQDVTERTRTEERLRASEAELKALFAAMNDVVLVLDAEEGRCLKVVSANPRLLYEPAEEQLGKTLHEVFPAEQADVFVGWIRRALETRQTVHTEYSLTIDGTRR